jgi:predicted RNA binding protein YcfA (HicA-like mRNA interferase family)
MKKEVWDQLKNITSGEIMQALERDRVNGWYSDETGSSATVYRNDNQGKVVSIHNHPHKTFGAKQLKELFKDIGWEEDDLKRLKLIK